VDWEAISAIGELIGATAVVATLVFLVVQMIQSTKVMEESNRLERAATMERHSDSIGRWRIAIAADRDLSRIWLSGLNKEVLDNIDQLRLDNLWVDFLNIQRSNYLRAKTVDNIGLMKQTSLSVAVEVGKSSILQDQWELGRH